MVRLLRDERGQALPIAVMVIAIAAVAVVGIRVRGDRYLAEAHLERTTAGASFAAVSALADVYVEWQAESKRVATERRRPLPDVMADPATLDRARTAADRIVAANGLARATNVWLTCAGGQVDVYVAIAGQEARSGFPAPECSRR